MSRLRVWILGLRSNLVSNLAFPSNTILSCFFPFFFIIDLHFLIPAVIAQIFNSAADLAIPRGTTTHKNEANAEIETQPLTGKLKIRKC